MHFSQADESEGVQVGTKPMVTAWLNGLLPFRGDSNGMGGGGGGQGLDNLKKLFSESFVMFYHYLVKVGVYVRVCVCCFFLLSVIQEAVFIFFRWRGVQFLRSRV